jgi:small subunit ribosomal protein S12
LNSSLQKKFKKKKHQWAAALQKQPQKRGVVVRARILTPRKPNSAKRPVAKIRLKTKLRLTAHIPGVGHNLRRHSAVLIRGGGARDLPGVWYTCIRGVYDFAGLTKKIRRRSIYGARRPAHLIIKKRRRFRHL